MIYCRKECFFPCERWAFLIAQKVFSTSVDSTVLSLPSHSMQDLDEMFLLLWRQTLHPLLGLERNHPLLKAHCLSITKYVGHGPRSNPRNWVMTSALGNQTWEIPKWSFFSLGKSSINWRLSIAMCDDRRVCYQLSLSCHSPFASGVAHH